MPGWYKYKAENTTALPDGSGDALFFSREDTSKRKQRRFNESDVFETTLELILGLTCFLTPQSFWPRICEQTSMLRRSRHMRRRGKHFLSIAECLFPDMSQQELSSLYDQYRALLHQRRISMLREYLRPGGPQFLLTGLDHFNAGLKHGKGAILWTGQFGFQTVTGKRGLCQSGLDIYQVSAAHHGFSHTVYGQSILNRPLVAAENRYLKGRLVFKEDEAAPVLRRAMKHLSGGEVVAFTNNLLAGRHFVQLPFGEGVWTAMPVTPLRLALRYQIPLFHVATLQNKPFSEYEIRISEDLAEGIRGKTSYENMALVAARARDLTLNQVRAYPAQYIGWPTLMPSPLFGAVAG